MFGRVRAVPRLHDVYVNIHTQHSRRNILTFFFWQSEAEDKVYQSVP
jgi:hypothetical protein